MEIWGADFAGIDGVPIRFTALKNAKRAGVTILGMPQRVVKEGLERAVAAIETLSGEWGDVLSNQGYTIDLDPAETPKKSSGLDLPIAIMLIQATVLQNQDSLVEQIRELEEKLDHASGEEKEKRFVEDIELLGRKKEIAIKYRDRFSKNKAKFMLIGKLEIASGQLMTPENGMFGMLASVKPGFHLIVPESSETHAALVAKATSGVKAIIAADLQEVLDVLLQLREPRFAQHDPKRVRARKHLKNIPDLNDMKGVAQAKQAMQVALAGGHNLLLVGPAGQGKSMLAKAALDLLPQLSKEEVFEVNKIYSARGLLEGDEIVDSRPYQQVHSGATPASIFGGGSGYPIPGMVSLAHRGILLFDEVNLFPKEILEDMRNILSNGVHEVQRAGFSARFPADVIFVAAMNPCKCGFFGHYQCSECGTTSLNVHCERHPKARSASRCGCTKRERDQFQRKLSGPILERIELKVLLSKFDEEPAGHRYASSTIKKQILSARERQERRYKDVEGVHCNADLEHGGMLKKYGLNFDDSATKRSRELNRSLELSFRVEHQLNCVALTIADLEGANIIRAKHLDVAAKMMGLGSEFFRGFGQTTD